MADNPFAKKPKGAQETKGEKQPPDGKSSPPPGKGQTSKGANPFAKKMDGKHPPRRHGRKPMRKGKGRGKLQPFQRK